MQIHHPLAKAARNQPAAAAAFGSKLVSVIPGNVFTQAPSVAARTAPHVHARIIRRQTALNAPNRRIESASSSQDQNPPDKNIRQPAVYLFL